MNRRRFIRNSLGLGFTPIFLNSTLLKAHNNLMGFEYLSCDEVQSRSLVFINLAGGNDGLNTIIPFEESRYALYKANRPKIAIPQSGTTGAIKLDSALSESRQVGLHPVMTGFKDLYDEGKLNVLQGAGYLNNSKSHFKATDHWVTGGDATPQLNRLESGWIGRYLQSVYPNNILQPTDTFVDPLGLELGSPSSSVLFKTGDGKSSNVILTVNASKYYSFVQNVGAPFPENYAPSQFRDEIEYINSVEKSVNTFSERITNVFNAGSNIATYPDNAFANQLKTVARLIKGGSQTKVFLVHQMGYDTHAQQVDTTNTSVGTHANLLKDLSEAVKAFQDDLAALGIEDKVITSTYSEFGRTIDENSSSGTDHGGVNPMFIIGKGVKPGVTGNPIDLTKVEDRGCVDLQYDYRTVYATLLQDFLAVDDAVVSSALTSQFINNKAPVLKSAYVAPASCYNSFSVLPVMLVDFTATPAGSDAVQVKWATSQERNAKDFVLERSADATNFEAITRVPAVGNSYTQQQYEWLDHDAQEGANYYRLLQSDLDGKYQYFGPVRVMLQKTRITNIKSFPNPSVNEFTLSVSSASRQKANIIFMDMEGHPLHQVSVQLVAGANTFQYNHLQFRGTKQLLIAIRLENGKLETLKHVMR
ncbi:MAG: DUF1501 domain-containing protein [Agriterribacter sp.]